MTETFQAESDSEKTSQPAISVSSVKSTGPLHAIMQRKARLEEKKAAREHARWLESIEARFKPSAYGPDAARDANEIMEVSLFSPEVRNLHPEMFLSPNRNDELDYAIWQKTGDPRKVRDAQSARGTRSRIAEKERAEKEKKRAQAIVSVSDNDEALARSRLDDWLAADDTPQKQQLRRRADELIVLWRGWTICKWTLSRGARKPRPGELAREVEALGGGAYVATEDMRRARHLLMLKLHSPEGPWPPA
jgi:hypothetical protein